MTKNDLKKIGNRLREARKAKQMTQEELAYEIDMSAPYIGMIERGERIPKIETFLEIIEALDVTADQIICDAVKYGYQTRLAEYDKWIATLPRAEQEKIFRVLEAMIKTS